VPAIQTRFERFTEVFMARLSPRGALLVLTVASTATLYGCPPPVDYGSPCQILDSKGQPVPIATCTGAASAGRNLIAFGATDCGDLVCVYTPGAPPGGYQNNGNNCWGYCSSASCLSDSDCQSGSSKGQMTCQPLLLSASVTAGPGCSVDGGSTTIPCGAANLYCAFPKQ
jgi:hypothetical protein